MFASENVNNSVLSQFSKLMLTKWKSKTEINILPNSAQHATSDCYALVACVRQVIYIYIPTSPKASKS